MNSNLTDLVIEWGANKGILAKSNPLSQFLKTVSEVGELADAVNKGDADEQQDAIGDVWVTLILLTELLDLPPVPVRPLKAPAGEDSEPKEAMAYLVGQLGVLAVAVSHTPYEVRAVQHAGESIGDVLTALAAVADELGHDMEECLAKAYGVISKRTGKIVNGVFVKDSAA